MNYYARLRWTNETHLFLFLVLDFFYFPQDDGDPPLESKTTVIVDVSDVSDNPPSFLRPIYLESIPENRPKVHCVSTDALAFVFSCYLWTEHTFVKCIWSWACNHCGRWRWPFTSVGTDLKQISTISLSFPGLLDCSSSSSRWRLWCWKCSRIWDHRW